jgi:hypothetical protein
VSATQNICHISCKQELLVTIFVGGSAQKDSLMRAGVSKPLTDLSRSGKLEARFVIVSPPRRSLAVPINALVWFVVGAAKSVES